MPVATNSYFIIAHATPSTPHSRKISSSNFRGRSGSTTITATRRNLSICGRCSKSQVTHTYTAVVRED